jgi:hypothetical protein
MAKHVLEWIYHDQGVPGAESVFDASWRSHGNVSHLWAAYLLRGMTFRVIPDVICGGVDHSENADFVRFLREAERLQQFIWRYSANEKARLLNAGTGKQSELWIVPSARHEVEWHPRFPRPLQHRYQITPEIQRYLDRYPEQPPRRKLGRPSKKVV